MVGELFHNVEWVPSQNGGVPVDLHPQSQTLPDLSALNPTGVMSVPLCEPSQYGCFDD